MRLTLSQIYAYVLIDQLENVRYLAKLQRLAFLALYAELRNDYLVLQPMETPLRNVLNFVVGRRGPVSRVLRRVVLEELPSLGLINVECLRRSGSRCLEWFVERRSRVDVYGDAKRMGIDIDRVKNIVAKLGDLSVGKLSKLCRSLIHPYENEVGTPIEIVVARILEARKPVDEFLRVVDEIVKSVGGSCEAFAEI